jgi:thioredoxin 1
MKTLIYFSAAWCQPCKTLSPIMEQVGKQVPVIKVDVDAQKQYATDFGIRNIPTVLLVENGKEVRRFTGVKSLNEIINFYK